MTKIATALELAQKRLEPDSKTREGITGDDLVFATLKLAVDIKRRDKNRLEGERRVLAHELSMADEVFALWHHHLIGNTRDRDWKILLGLAAGGNVRNVSTDISKTHVSRIKQLQCHNIWLNVACYMPGVDPIDMAMKLAESIASESPGNCE